MNKKYYSVRATLLQIANFRLQVRIKATLKYLKLIPKMHLLKKTKAKKNSKKGKNCIVIANGPSSLGLLKYEKSFFENIDVIVINGFYASKIATHIIPTYYVVSDPRYNFDTPENYRDFDKRNAQLFSYLKSRDISLWCPLDFSNHISIDIYNFINIENTFNNNFRDITKPQSCLRSTSLIALMIATYLGYDNIGIIGFDNSYVKFLEVDHENRLNYEVPHINSEGRVYLDQVEGFFNDTGLFYYHEHRAFSDLNYFETTKITNLDKQSLLSSFNKQEFLNWMS